MALQKLITLPNGSSGNYLKIDNMHVNKQQMKISVELSLFLNSAHSNGQAVQKRFKKYTFPITKTSLSGNIIKFLYEQIKLKNEIL